jgi:DsbC/DsbD-like thiol-disulfide interchange protein
MTHAERAARDKGWTRGTTLVFLSALCAPAMAADAYSTDWAKAAKSDARLLAADSALAGFEIRLAPGAITYWRDPGEAGVPPTFDVSGSDNVAKVEPVFPAPKRIKEQDGSEAFGYDGGVVIPLKVEPRDPAKPVTLQLDANYAVCEKLCLPARAKLTLTLPGATSPYASTVQAALAAAPRPVEPAAFGKFKSDGAGAWRLCAAHEAGPPRDLFVEPPEGWRVTAAPAPGGGAEDCFALTLRDKPKDAALPAPLRLTMTGGTGPVETSVIAQ